MSMVIYSQGHTIGKCVQHTKMFDHLDHSSNRNGASLKVQPRFKCLKIAFHWSGLTSIFKTTCCRDSENPEDIVYQLSVTWKHDVIWRHRNAERNCYVTSYQTIPGPTAFSDFPEPWEGCQSHRSDRCQPLSQDRSWPHADTNEEWASCGIHWAKWDFTAIQTPSSADSQARATCPDTVTHSPHWMPNQQSEHRTHSFSHLHIFIQHLSSWHGSPSILTFRPLWHSTNKSHSLGLISTRIQKVGALCLVSVL